MAMSLVVVGFCLGLVCIITGGDVLVRAAIKLNKVSGINTVIIGATFVSVATTLPEAFISVFAVMAGNHGIAVGNAIGAMIANVSLVLAVSLVFIPAVIKRGEIIYKTLFLLGILVIVLLFAMDLKISWYEGAILIVAFAMFLFMNYFEEKSKSRTIETVTSSEILSKNKKNNVSWFKIALGFVFGQAMLCVGAYALVENGERLAHMWGISETVIGFTIIAIGTSLPELVTAISSIRGKCGGLAIGNVIGANIINCTLLLGLCGVIGGSYLPISRETAFVALPVLILMTSVAILPILFRGKAHRAQGITLLGLYIAYVAYLFIVQPL